MEIENNSLDDASRPPALERESSRISPARAAAIFLALVLNIAILVGGIWALTNQQRIEDQFVVWNFEPSDNIRQYATASGMSDEGEFLFYASRPRVQSNPLFNQTCSNVEENFGVLGCYFPSTKSIFLYDVTDERLAGLEEVVAAHEMLHAAWDRLSTKDRKTLSVLLEVETSRMKENPEFAKILDFYAKTEPGERANELHSIIGTEFAEISPALEAHYSRYFSDRSRVVALHTSSNEVFTKQLAASEALVERLDQLHAHIEDSYADYNAGYDRLNADINDFNTRADAGGFIPTAQLTEERDSLLERQSALNEQYKAIEFEVAEYDDLVAELEELNSSISELNKSINVEPRTDGL